MQLPLSILLLSLLLSGGESPVTTAPAFSFRYASKIVGPVALHAPNWVALTEQGFVGVEPKTGLVRVASEPIPRFRRYLPIGKDLLVLGQDLARYDPGTGKTRWEFPLNCRSNADCQLEVLDWNTNYVLVAGFGAARNRLMVLRTANGQQHWAGWVNTETARFAHLSKDRVLVVSDDPKVLLRLVDLRSRRRLSVLAPPAPNLRPERAWFDGNDAVVQLTGPGGSSLALLRSGALTAQVKLPPAATRIHAWPRAGKAAWLLGGKLELRSLAGSSKPRTIELQPGAVLSEGPDDLLILTDRSKGVRLERVGIDPDVPSWTRDLPLPRARLVRKGDRLFMAGEDWLAVLDSAGDLQALGKLPPGSRFADVMESGTDGYALVNGANLLVLARRPFKAFVDGFLDALDHGRLKESSLMLALIKPFRASLPQAETMRLALRATAYNRMLQTANRADWTRVTTDLAAHLRGCAPLDKVCVPRVIGRVNMLLSLWFMSKSSSNPEPKALQHIGLWLLMAARQEWAPETAWQLVLEIAVALADLGALEDSETLMKGLRSIASVSARLPAHPLTRLLAYHRLKALLKAADQAARDQRWKDAAEHLKAITKVPASKKLFGEMFDPLLDASAIGLLPPELLPEKVPPIVNALSKKFRTAYRKEVDSVKGDACAERCERAAKACPHPCATPPACEAVYEGCLETCMEGGGRWRLPEYEPGLRTEGFLRCR